MFNWDNERITNDSLTHCVGEIEFVRKLQLETIVCPTCQRRRVIDTKVEGIEYCKCPDDDMKSVKIKSWAKNGVLNQWEPYLERKNMVVWRREERPGLYAYKGIGI